MQDALLRVRVRQLLVVVIVTVLSCLRCAHIHLLWADEDYHLGAALEILHGKVPYRDFWYDKPPLSALYYTLIGALPGWPLRLLDVLYILTACWFAYRLARTWWGEAEGYAAAALLAFFTTFYLPSAVIPFAADALMLVPHLAAIYYAARKMPLAAGGSAGVAFLVNPKGVFVLAACAIWIGPAVWRLVGGFLLPVSAAGAAALGWGAWNGYVDQVWRWGFRYAEGSPLQEPLKAGLIRTADWLGFHAALAGGVGLGLAHVKREMRWRLGAWLLLSFAGVCLGMRFTPRYFLQFVAPMVIVAARGIVLAAREYGKPALAVLALALLAPLLRFGPRYVSLALDDISGRQPNWNDVALDLDSQDAARKIRSLARPGDTLFVWGYRPDIYVYSRMIPSERFVDSQPLTGVPADRHLTETNPIYSGADGSDPAARNRQVFVLSHPTFVVDGLGLLNAKLRPDAYPEVRHWLEGYRLVDRTKLSLIFRRIQ